MGLRLLFLCFWSIWIATAEYYGLYLGRLRNASYALDGQVYMVNSTHLQIVDFTIKRVVDRSNIAFLFVSDRKRKRAGPVHEFKDEDTKWPWVKAYTKELRDGATPKHLVVEVPKGSQLTDWTQFGIANTDETSDIALVSVKGAAPEPYCCITDGSNSFSIKGEYGAYIDPIRILDAKTIVLPNFSFLGTKPPDAWIYAGRGKILQGSGKKAFILGRDEQHHHCAIHEDLDHVEMVVQLAGDQTVYDIEWISVFCYQYEHNFGHVAVNLTAKHDPIPAFIPPVRTAKPPHYQKVPCDE